MRKLISSSAQIISQLRIIPLYYYHASLGHYKKNLHIK
uniref:Uncharacterized protein n=1 Tax=Arundo donax TaxID=35708 RepID=A0A0A8ZQ71_ARUDO